MTNHQYLFKGLLIIIPTLSCLSLIDSSKDDGIYRIPLVRGKSALQMLMEKEASNELIEGLIKMGSRSIKNPATNDTLPLFKYFDSEYYGMVNIGKPGRTFKMIFDTAWAHSWVISVDCPLIRLPCALHHRYDHRLSSTYIKNGSIFNISGELEGYMSKDVFLVGQMKSSNQFFAEISKLPWLYSLMTSDGIVGLGFQAMSPGFLPFFYNLNKENPSLKQPIFSFYINRDPTTKHGGSILFGGIDKRHQKSNFTIVNIINNGYWTFRMNKVKLVISSLKYIEFCKNGCTATADTSTNSIIGPPDDIKEINTQIGTEGTFFNRALIPCATEFKGPKVNFTIANKEFQILARDYIQKISYAGVTVCLSAFQAADADSLAISNWRLGGAFFYQFYTAFHVRNREIMIAEAA